MDRVAATMTAGEEYLIYRKALRQVILKRGEIKGVDIKRILHAGKGGVTS